MTFHFVTSLIGLAGFQYYRTQYNSSVRQVFIEVLLVDKYVYQGWRSRGPASVSRPASRPNFNGLGLGLGLGCRCLDLSLGPGGPGFVYRVSRTGLGLGLGLGHPCLGLGLGRPGLDYNPGR